MKPFVVPVFITNQGCPHRCIFCDQENITSQPSKPIRETQVKEVLQEAISSRRFEKLRRPEVAFYGGTFTALPLSRMKSLLDAVSPFIREGLFSSIRVSTRPDTIDEKRLEILKSRSVLTVELGAQSMDNQVLSLCQRGHTAEDTTRAIALLKEYGFRVGIQLLPGLPGDSRRSHQQTISRVLSSKPDMVRLYPALVVRGTELYRWYMEGRYRPLTLQEAVDICAESCMRLETAGIPVIRMGLMSSPSLLEEGRIAAGPWHPSFGFLVRSSIYHKIIAPGLTNPGNATSIKVQVPQNEIPLLRGYRNQGLRWIEQKTGAKVVKVEPNDTLPATGIRIKAV